MLDQPFGSLDIKRWRDAPKSDGYNDAVSNDKIIDDGLVNTDDNRVITEICTTFFQQYHGVSRSGNHWIDQQNRSLMLPKCSIFRSRF